MKSKTFNVGRQSRGKLRFRIKFAGRVKMYLELKTKVLLKVASLILFLGHDSS